MDPALRKASQAPRARPALWFADEAELDTGTTALLARVARRALGARCRERYWRQSPLIETRSGPFPAKSCGLVESPYGAPVLRIERRIADTHRTFPQYPHSQNKSGAGMIDMPHRFRRPCPLIRCQYQMVLI
jgi:hypothetical protein